jgi:peptidase M23-like protein/alpha/beta hydrolase family protein
VLSTLLLLLVRSRRFGVLALACLLLPATGARPAAAQTPPAVVHRPPVDAVVVDPFRPPPRPYAAGNRGLTYDTAPGDPVRASAAGTVVFAGSVAGTLHVTVRHADGLRTSYSFLHRVDVVVGQPVGQGHVVGLAGDELHFGARRGDHYLDPASLFAGTAVEVELLPLEVPPGSTPDEERAALLVLAAGQGRSRLAGLLGDGASALRHYLVDANPVVRLGRLTGDVVHRLISSTPCRDEPPPPRPAAGSARVALTVGGLGSSSTSASIDELQTGALGYAADAVVRFSYAGGRTPGTGAAFDGVPARAYDSADTQGDLRTAARRLADLVEALARDRPGMTVDLYAHSMGGVVTRLALWELAGRGFDLGRLGIVGTLGSPHRGADLATAALAARSGGAGEAALGALESLLDTGLDPGSVAVGQLAETSNVIHELGERGVPDGVELVSVGASGDLVVAAPNTAVDGARNVTVGLTGSQAHGDLVADGETTDALARTLAGVPPDCEGVAEVIGETVTGHAISYAEDLGGLVVAP